jgi:hypothetical protein
LKEQPKENEKRCMPFYDSFKSSVSEVVSTKRSKAVREKEASRVTKGEHKKKGEFEGEIYKKQRTFKPYTHFF